MVGYAVFTTQYLQLVLGLSPLEAALWSLVPSVPVGGAAPLADARWPRRCRPGVRDRRGFVIAAVGVRRTDPQLTRTRCWLVLAGAGVLAAGWSW